MIVAILLDLVRNLSSVVIFARCKTKDKDSLCEIYASRDSLILCCTEYVRYLLPSLSRQPQFFRTTAELDGSCFKPIYFLGHQNRHTGWIDRRCMMPSSSIGRPHDRKLCDGRATCHASFMDQTGCSVHSSRASRDTKQVRRGQRMGLCGLR